MYATYQTGPVDGNLLSLKSKVEQPTLQTENIDQDFLQKEISKRRPPPVKKSAGVQLIQLNTESITRQPRHLKTNYKKHPNPVFKVTNNNITEELAHKTLNKSETYSNTFNDMDKEVHMRNYGNENINKNEALNGAFFSEKGHYPNRVLYVSERTSPKATKAPKKYLSWKYFGSIGGRMGITSAKITCEKKKNADLLREFSDLPYIAEQYIPYKQKIESKMRTKSRDLFTLSLSPESKQMAKQQAVTSLISTGSMYGTGTYPAEETQLFIQTEDDKLIPLRVSRMHRK